MRDIHLQADSIEGDPGRFVPAIKVVMVGPENTRTDCGVAWIGTKEYIARQAAENEAADYALLIFRWLLNRSSVLQ